MTRLTPHPVVHVGSMAEVRIVWQVMHLYPLDGLICSPAIPHQLQPWRIRQDLAMAVDAGLRRRDIGFVGHLHPIVAVAAVHAQLARMDAVTERDRLLRRIPHFIKLGRKVIPDQKHYQYATKDRSCQRQGRKPVCLFCKNLRHNAQMPKATSLERRKNLRHAKNFAQPFLRIWDKKAFFCKNSLNITGLIRKSQS